MNYYRKYIGYGCLLAVFALAGCSTKKNTFVSRNYHNLTAHYNGFYNARERVRNGAKKLSDAEVDKYDRILKIFKFGDDNEAKGVYADMDEAIKKSSIVISKHSMNIHGKERCNWIDDNWLVIGKAQFYKHDYWAALETFQYVSTEYKDQVGRYDGFLYLALTYMELGKMVDTEYLLDYLKNDKKFPREFKGFFEAVSASYYQRKKDYSQTINHLEKAVILAKKRENRIRYTFILGQLYQKLDSCTQATERFKKVIKMNPSYEMSFNAKISLGRCYIAEGGDRAGVKKLLMKMLRDSKNAEYKDQIYYGLARVALKENDEPKAEGYLHNSLEASTTNTEQKALSYLELGAIHLKRQEYKLASAYYDSTMMNLDKDYPDYDDINDVKTSLSKLIKNMEIITKEDSLQRYIVMTPEEREKAVEELIKKEEEERKKLKEEERLKKEQQKEVENQPISVFDNQNDVKKNNTNTGGNWYFVNNQAISFGFNEFTKKWGNRKLEDDWRRGDKTVMIATTETDSIVIEPEDTLTTENDSLLNIILAKKKEKYLKAMPISAQQKEESDIKIEDAYYTIAIIYKEQLNNPKASSENFLELLRRYPESKYKLACYFNLFRVYLSMKDTVTADKYKNILLNDYPESDYAKILNDPEYFNKKQNKTALAEIFYETTYQIYLNGQYSDVIERKDLADKEFPQNKLTPKFDLLKALAIGKTRPLPEFVAALSEVTIRYPNDSVKYKAQEFLDYIKHMNNPQDTAALMDTSTIGPLFIYQPDSEHYYLLIFPNKGVDMNMIKTKFSNFNNEYFSIADLKISNAFFDKDDQYILIKSFKTSAEAYGYKEGVATDENIFPGLDRKLFKVFTITDYNWQKLYKEKNLKEYSAFYQNSYKE